MRIKVGLVGTSQLSFPGPKEKVYAEIVEQMKKNAEEMGFDLFVWEKQVIVEADAKEAVAKMEAEKIDFLMVLNVSYSAGFLVPYFYRIKNAAVGIWSIPEPTEGPVMFNSFCSNNMYQGINDKYLRDYKIKAKWFYGMADDKRFKKRLSVTVKALQAIKKLKNSRVALIGGFAPGFYDLYFDERSVYSKLDGIYINRLHEYDEIIKRAEKITDNDMKAQMAEFDKVPNADMSPFADVLKKSGLKMANNSFALRPFSVKMYLAYKQFVEEYGYDAIAISCWPKFQDDYKYSVCSTIGMLNDDKIVAACEGDLMSAISMVALQEMSGDSTTLMDFSAFDEKDDSILLWHCGPSSKRFCEKNGYKISHNFSGMAHDEGLVCGTGIVRDMEFDPGKASVFRFSGDMESYINVTGDFIGNTKVSNCGSRGWFKNLKLNGKEIGALDFTNTILSGGFEHHYPVAWGDLGDEIAEMNKWLGIKPVKKIPYENYLQDSEDEE